MLTEGVDADGKPPTHPGFMIFATQNPSSEKGVKALSPAMLNRSHVIYLEPYSQASLTAIAENSRIKHPHLFARSYDKCQIKKPKTTMRTFYSAAATVR